MSHTDPFPSNARDLANRIEEHFAAFFGIHQSIILRHRLENLIEEWFDKQDAEIGDDSDDDDMAPGPRPAA